MINNEKRNIYNNIQNLYNMDFTSWQEVLAMMYNLVADTSQKFEAFEQKFGLMLGSEVTKAIKQLHENGTLASIINSEVFKNLNSKIDYLKDNIEKTKKEITEQLNNKANLYTVDLEMMGCLLDGITDDSEKLQIALNKGNVIFPKGKTIKLGNINIPNNRTLDLNGCTIVGCSSPVFKIGENTNSYFRDVIIRNGFIEPTQEGAVINMVNCIDCKIENIKIPHLLDNSHGIRMVNGFNNIFDKIWVMTGKGRLTNASAVNIRTQESEKIGVSNITNIEIKNCLFQNMQYGILVDATSFSIDTLKIHNQGISDCTKGIYFVSPSSLLKACNVDTLRVENSDIGIDNNSAISANNLHFYNTTLAINNNPQGKLWLGGIVNFATNVTKGIKNIGYGFFDKAIFIFDKSTTKFELNHHTRPWDAMTKTNSSREFNDFIDPIFNTKINQAVYFEFSDLPTTGVQEGTELIIYANGNWNPKVSDNIFYTGFKYGCLHLKFHDRKWLIIGDSNITIT